MKLQQLYSQVRRAIDDYHMIDTGDKIAIGVSGGKDSLTLLYALAGLRSFYPHAFDLVAISVDLGFTSDGANATDDSIRALCQKLEVSFHVVHTQIGKIVFEARKEHSPCSLCAKMRKGALNTAAMELGCNKVAYAHHMDDIIETMFLSMIYEGKFYSFPPVTMLERSGLTVIRPMMYVSEADVIGFKNRYELPVKKNACPVDGSTRREYVKQLIRQINQENPGVKKRFFHAITSARLSDWPIIDD